MKEYSIQLIDCLRLIWEKKLFIIAGTIVSLVAGGVVSLRLPKVYHAEALIRMGKKVNPSLIFPATYTWVDSTSNMAAYIPAIYGNNEEFSKYHINVEEAANITMVRVSLEGPERGRAKELLKEVSDKLIDDHLRVSENALQFYKNHIKNFKEDLKMYQKNKLLLEEMRDSLKDKESDPLSVVTLMASIWEREKKILETNRSLSKIMSLFDSIENHKTTVIGGIKAGKDHVKPNMKRNIIVTGLAGLWMSISLALIIGYLRKIKLKRGDG